MVDVEYLEFCLVELLSEYKSKQTKETIETLLTIHRNILEDEDNLKFRKLRPENQTFSRKVWNFEPARNFMRACGWIEVRDLLVFNNDENLIDIIQALLDYRLLALPEEIEWEEKTKVENLNSSQEKEEELRRKAALDREKELKEYQKEKLYRQQLNEKIKAQIAEDRQKNQNRFTKPVVGNKLDKGAKLRPLSSLRDSGSSASSSNNGRR